MQLKAELQNKMAGMSEDAKKNEATMGAGFHAGFMYGYNVGLMGASLAGAKKTQSDKIDEGKS